MKDEKELKTQLENLLTRSNAHMGFEEAVKNYPMDEINTIFPNGEYSAWDLVEHIRRVQADILEFLESDNYQEKNWPEDFWPENTIQATAEDWENTIRRYSDDLKSLVKILNDPDIKLTGKVPNGNGQSYMREFLLVADHTAYHIGEFAIMRQTMNTWGIRE